MLQSTCKVPNKIEQMTSLINKFSKITINITISLISKTPSLMFIEVDSIYIVLIYQFYWNLAFCSLDDVHCGLQYDLLTF